MDDDGENTDDEFPSDEEMHDQFKETEKDVPTENKYDNQKPGTTTNDDGVRRSTKHKPQRAPYVPSMVSNLQIRRNYRILFTILNITNQKEKNGATINFTWM